MSENKFLDLLVDLMDTESELTMNMQLDDIEEWDSLSYVAFLAMATRQTGRRIEPSEVKAARTVKDLYELVK